MSRADYDFIVAGSGAAGAALAGRLSAGGARVLLLERGGRPEPEADGTRAVARYYANSGLTAALGRGLYPLAVGRGLGGTTAINSGTCLRPPQDALARWEREAPGFDAGRFSGWVEQAWTALKVKSVPRERCGGSAALFLKGLDRLGVPGGHLLDRAEDGCEGSGRCCFVCPRGAKMTSAKAFLDPLGARGPEVRLGARLLSAEPAPRPGGAVTARVREEGAGERTLRCGALVLSCGSLATPYFLRRLGVRAGSGLSIHPAAKVFALFEEPVRGWEGVPQSAGLHESEEPRLRFEGAFVPPEVAPLTLPLEGRRLRWWMERYERVASFGFMVRDLARGSVRHPLGQDLPVLFYEPAPEDVRLLARGMRRVAEVYFAAGASRVLLPLNRPDNELTRAGRVDSFDWGSIKAREIQMMGFHPLGTAGLGRAVGADLRAAEGIFVCDGSVIPESLGVNPQITIYAFALGLAERLLEGEHAS